METLTGAPLCSSRASTSSTRSLSVLTIMSAPSAAIFPAASSERTVVMTRAPNAFASGMAALARPDLPAGMNAVCPGCKCPSMNRFRYDVANASGSAAASIRLKPFGTGMSIFSFTAAYCAYPPPPSSAHTRSPARHFATFSPVLTITPAISSPIQGGQPGGEGYLPCRWRRSARLSAAAWTLTSTSSSAISGVGTSTQWNAPLLSVSMAFIASTPL